MSSAFYIFEENREGKLIFKIDKLEKELQAYETVHVVSIFGSQNSAKSTLANVFLGRKEFEIGNQGRHTTRGIQGVVEPFPGHEKCALLVVDSEGNGSNETKDARILALTCLVSDEFIFNFKETFDANAELFRKRFIQLQKMKEHSHNETVDYSQVGTNVTLLYRDYHYEDPVSERFKDFITTYKSDELSTDSFGEFLERARIEKLPPPPVVQPIDVAQRCLDENDHKFDTLRKEIKQLWTTIQERLVSPQDKTKLVTMWKNIMDYLYSSSGEAVAANFQSLLACFFHRQAEKSFFTKLVEIEKFVTEYPLKYRNLCSRVENDLRKLCNGLGNDSYVELKERFEAQIDKLYLTNAKSLIAIRWKFFKENSSNILNIQQLKEAYEQLRLQLIRDLEGTFPGDENLQKINKFIILELKAEFDNLTADFQDSIQAGSIAGRLFRYEQPPLPAQPSIPPKPSLGPAPEAPQNVPKPTTTEIGPYQPPEFRGLQSENIVSREVQSGHHKLFGFKDLKWRRKTRIWQVIDKNTGEVIAEGRDGKHMSTARNKAEQGALHKLQERYEELNRVEQENYSKRLREITEENKKKMEAYTKELQVNQEKAKEFEQFQHRKAQIEQEQEAKIAELEKEHKARLDKIQNEHYTKTAMVQHLGWAFTKAFAMTLATTALTDITDSLIEQYFHGYTFTEWKESLQSKLHKSVTNWKLIIPAAIVTALTAGTVPSWVLVAGSILSSATAVYSVYTNRKPPVEGLVQVGVSLSGTFIAPASITAAGALFAIRYSVDVGSKIRAANRAYENRLEQADRLGAQSGRGSYAVKKSWQLPLQELYNILTTTPTAEMSSLLDKLKIVSNKVSTEGAKDRVYNSHAVYELIVHPPQPIGYQRIATWNEMGLNKVTILKCVGQPDHSNVQCVSLSCHLLAISVLASQFNSVQKYPVESVMQVHGIACTGKRATLLMEDTIGPFLELEELPIHPESTGVHQLLRMRGLPLRDAFKDEFLGNILAQVILSLAQLQETVEFSHGRLHPANIALQFSSDVSGPEENDSENSLDETEESGLTRSTPLVYNINNTRYELPNFGYVAKILLTDTSALTIGNKRFVNNDIRESIRNQLVADVGYRTDTLRRAALECTSMRLNSSWDLATLMCSLLRTETLDLWRHPLVASYFDCDYRLQAEVDGTTEAERWIYDSLEDLLPIYKERFDAILSVPSSAIRLDAPTFAKIIMDNDMHVLRFPPSIPAQPIQPCVPPIKQPNRLFFNLGEQFKEKGRDTVNFWLDRIKHQSRMFLSAEEWDKQKLFVSSNNSMIDELQPVKDCPYFIAKGKGGGEIYRAKSENDFYALKRFQVSTTELTSEIDISGDHFQCSDTTCEIIATSVCGELYEQGISPHFPRVYGILQEVQTQSIVQKTARYFGLGQSAPEIVHVDMVMELLDGNMLHFGSIVSKLQQKSKKDKKTPPGREVYIHNAIFQVAAALHEFHRCFKGMHNDLHLGNVMIKICDDTKYRGKKLNEITHWEYNINGIPFKLPNLGFLVKLADFGLSSIQLSKDILSGDEFKGSPLSGYSCEKATTYRLKPSSILWTESIDRFSQIPLFIDIGKRFAAGVKARCEGYVRPAFDLQVVMNNFSTHPLTYRNSATINYEELEILRTYVRCPCNNEKQLFSALRIDTCQGLFNKPTFRLPKSIEDAVTLPHEFLCSGEFVQYRDWGQEIPYAKVLELRGNMQQLEICDLVLQFHEQWWEKPTYKLPGTNPDVTQTAFQKFCNFWKTNNESEEEDKNELRSQNSEIALSELRCINDSLLYCGLRVAGEQDLPPHYEFYNQYSTDLEKIKDRSDDLYKRYNALSEQNLEVQYERVLGIDDS